MTFEYSFFPSWTDPIHLFSLYLLFLLKIVQKPQRSSCVRWTGGTAGGRPLPNVDVTRSRSQLQTTVSSFQTRLLAGCVCFLTPQSVDSWYMYQHIHTHTNIRKPFCFFLSDSLSTFTQSDLNWFNYSEATKTPTFKWFFVQCTAFKIVTTNCQSLVSL